MTSAALVVVAESRCGVAEFQVEGAAERQYFISRSQDSAPAM